MPDASHYLRQANALLSMSLAASNPVVAAKFWEIAEDYLAKAVKLRVDDGLPALPRSRFGLQAVPTTDVIAGLVPATSIREAPCQPNRDGRNKSGHDNEKVPTQLT
jgi:hypothetical protein